jgi:hypothetical protein
MLPTRLQGLSASRRLICFFSSLIVFKESRFLKTRTQYVRVCTIQTEKKRYKRLFF